MNTETLLEYILDNCTPDYGYYGLPVFTIDGEDVAIARELKEAEEAAKEYIKDSVWAFNASFLASHIANLDEEDIDSIRGDRCEDANPALLKLIDDFDAFAKEAIATDGLGHFLATYDGEEREIGDFLIFRIN